MKFTIYMCKKYNIMTYNPNQHLNSDDLYILERNRLTIYVDKVEDDIDKKHDITLYYMSYSNASFTITYNIGMNTTYEIARKLKKYFLDNLPFVKRVEFSKYGLTIDFDRENGLDVLNIYTMY